MGCKIMKVCVCPKERVGERKLEKSNLHGGAFRGYNTWRGYCFVQGEGEYIEKCCSYDSACLVYSGYRAHIQKRG